MKRFVVALAGPVALAAGVVAPVTLAAVGTSDGMARAADAATEVNPLAALAVGVEGTDGQLWAQAPQLGGGWHPLGGKITAPPAVAAPPNPNSAAAAAPLFIATGTTKALYIRSLSSGWQPVGAARCIGGPAAVMTGSALTVACRGTDNALWYTTATVPASGLPVFTGGWRSLGGVLSAGPAIAPVGTTVTFFVRGTNGRIYTRTAAAGYTAMPWGCIGSPAAAQQAATGITTFACQGTDHALWEAGSDGAGWSGAVSLGGALIGGPAVAAGTQQTAFLAEGTNQAVWQRTPAGWSSLGGTAVGGVGAAALNMAAGASWGNAIEVPGTAALNAGGVANINSLSCPSAGNCAAGGQYASSSGNFQAFVADEVNGTWGNAIEVPGAAALNTVGDGSVSDVSCGSAGNCAAIGFYTDGSAHQQVFVADEVNGTWGNAIEVPGTAALNTGGSAAVGSLACPSAGNCVAGGHYTDSSGDQQAFVADEVNGTWGNAIEVPGTAALNTGGGAYAFSVSCASAGNCAAGGEYTDGSGHQQAFVADEVTGAWGNAIEVPGTAALNTGGSAAAVSVSCASAGDCSAGGSYAGNSGTQAFVVSEANGTWGNAIEVPGSAALNTWGSASVGSLSCPSAGNCTVGGTYTDSSALLQAFVADEVNGTWGDAIQVPGSASTFSLMNKGTHIASMSCASAGNCTVGGAYADNSGRQQAFVASEVNGTWGDAIEVPGTAALNTGGFAVVYSVSCPSAGSCAAGGAYTDSSLHSQAFVISQT